MHKQRQLEDESQVLTLDAPPAGPPAAFLPNPWGSLDGAQAAWDEDEDETADDEDEDDEFFPDDEEDADDFDDDEEDEEDEDEEVDEES